MAERIDWIQRLKNIQYNTIQFINTLLLFKPPLLALNITPACETLTYRLCRLVITVVIVLPFIPCYTVVE